MSYDRQLNQLCTHYVRDEVLTLESDRRTVRPLRPIAASNSVRVRVGGDIDVPPTGVYSRATVVGTREEPFAISQSQNRLILRVGQGPAQELVVPASRGTRMDVLLGTLNQQVVGVTFEADRRRVRMATNASGREATVTILPGSTLALGIPVGREYRGALITPGWSLVQGLPTLDGKASRAVVFDDPLRGYQELVEVSYATRQQECRRCGGVGVENDWVYGKDGSVVELRDEALLIQEVQKAIFTVRGSNPFNSWYGSSLLDRIGQKTASFGLINNLITTDIQQAFARWQSIKSQQEDAGQRVSEAEFPYRLTKLSVTPSSSDPTTVFVDITIQNRSFRPVNITRGIRVPNPLNGANNTAQDPNKWNLVS